MPAPSPSSCTQPLSGALSDLTITSIETVRLAEFPNLLWLQVNTASGLVGLGETFFGAQAVEAYVHESVAPAVIGMNAGLIERVSCDLRGYVGYSGSGVETRGNSAVDIALWDILGQATGQPVHQLLGGKVRDRIRVYNTCAGPGYMRQRSEQSVRNWGLSHANAGGLEDLVRAQEDAGGLAKELLSEGITGMKIWPFDRAAERAGGLDISASEIEAALQPLRCIREAVGDAMDVMIEFHGLWSLPPIKRIAEALRELDPYWFEDPLRPDGLTALANFARSTPVPVAASETLGGRAAYHELMQRDAAGVVLLDVAWCGGISEARKIAAAAETMKLPVAPHDCTGPIVLAASTHLCMHLPNALAQEFVRAYHRGWYGDIVTDLPVVEDGHIVAPPGPGLGLRLRDDVKRRSDATVRSTTTN